jgi:hypothetical protein
MDDDYEPVVLLNDSESVSKLALASFPMARCYQR